MTDIDGKKITDGEYAVTFKLYTVATGGTPIWFETQSITVSNGILNMALGMVNSLDLPFDQPYWLSVTIGTRDEVTQRMPLTSTPYSLSARSVPDSVITSDKIASGQVVKSINSMTDDVILTAGENVTITQKGHALIIAVSVGTDDKRDLATHVSKKPGGVPNLQQVTDSGSTTTRAIIVDSDGDEQTVIGGSLAVNNTLYVNSSGSGVGIGTATPSEALELGENKRIKLTTNLTNLAQSALIKLKWGNSTGKPAIVWFNESDDRQAAIVAYDYLTYPGNRHKHLSFETSDNSGALQTRLEIPWGNTVEIRTSDANFKVGGGHNFIVGSDGQPGKTILNSNSFITRTRKLGVGFTNASQAFYSTASMELYRDGSNVEFLIHEDAGTKEARLHFRRGTRDWEIINNGDLAIEVEDGEVFRITKAGSVGIGTKSPNHPLEMASGAHVTSGGVRTNASSREYKENIRELTSQEALTALDELVPVQFNYKRDREDDYLGFIAEDVPALVASKNRKGLSSMDIVAVLTKVVKAQQKKIEELEKKFDERK